MEEFNRNEMTSVNIFNYMSNILFGANFQYAEQNDVIVVPLLVSECCARVEHNRAMLLNSKNYEYLQHDHNEIEEATNVGVDIALCMSIVQQYIEDLDIDFETKNKMFVKGRNKMLLFPFLRRSTNTKKPYMSLIAVFHLDSALDRTKISTKKGKGVFGYMHFGLYQQKWTIQHTSTRSLWYLLIIEFEALQCHKRYL